MSDEEDEIIRVPGDLQGFAAKWWRLEHLKSAFESALDVAVYPHEFEGIGGDYYDNSLEMMKVDDDLRLSVEVQTLIRDAGFYKVYVNHKDGWQTHYTLGSNELPVRGWRRRYVSDASVDTTRVIAGDEDNGYYEISYWPEGWDRCRNWLETGYMRLVPDPLDPFAAGDPA